MGRELAITGHTELIGLVATPIRHSMSPQMHNAAFDALGLDYVYLVFEVGKEELKDTVAGLRAMKVRGWNVSMPNKGDIGQYLDHVSLVSELCGAINTVVNDNGVLTGTSTDGTGFVRALSENGLDIKGKKLVLLGAGGAAAAIMAQCAIDGAKEIVVFNKKDSFYAKAQERLKLIEEKTGVEMHLYDIDDKALLKQEIDSADVLANATSVGMVPHQDSCLVEESDLHEGLYV
ncbi:quinate/shikimate dehydrogenase, partial [uncultured Sharpea sp.]